MADQNHRALSIVLVVTGIAFMLLYPLMTQLESWSWTPAQHEYEQMIMGVYFVLGVFALIAARNPTRHLSLIWFIAISNLVHGVIMAAQALADPLEYSNFYGDIPALIITGVLIATFAPKRFSAAPKTLAGAVD